MGALLADAGRLGAYLEAGHPLVWNRARGVSAEVDALAAALGEALGAHVWPNVYATGTAGTPLDVHFDSHEVIAVQCVGHMEWTISAVRGDRPLDCAEMEPAVAAAQRGRRDEAAARPLLRFSVGPGSVVYVPRGQFHNASTPAGRSLHVTFGIRPLAGFDDGEAPRRARRSPEPGASGSSSRPPPPIPAGSAPPRSSPRPSRVSPAARLADRDRAARRPGAARGSIAARGLTLVGRVPAAATDPFTDDGGMSFGAKCCYELRARGRSGRPQAWIMCPH